MFIHEYYLVTSRFDPIILINNVTRLLATTNLADFQSLALQLLFNSSKSLSFILIDLYLKRTCPTIYMGLRKTGDTRTILYGGRILQFGRICSRKQ